VTLLPIVIRDPVTASDGSAAVLAMLLGETVTVFEPDVTVVLDPLAFV